MTFTKEDVLYFAEFAHIGVDEADQQLFAPQLEELVQFTNVLREIDTEGVAPMTHVLQRVNVMREDEPNNVLSRDEMLSTVEEKADGMIVVPNTF